MGEKGPQNPFGNFNPEDFGEVSPVPVEVPEIKPIEPEFAPAVDYYADRPVASDIPSFAANARAGAENIGNMAAGIGSVFNLRAREVGLGVAYKAPIFSPGLRSMMKSMSGAPLRESDLHDASRMLKEGARYLQDRYGVRIEKPASIDEQKPIGVNPFTGKPGRPFSDIGRERIRGGFAEGGQSLTAPVQHAPWGFNPFTGKWGAPYTKPSVNLTSKKQQPPSFLSGLVGGFLQAPIETTLDVGLPMGLGAMESTGNIMAQTYARMPGVAKVAGPPLRNVTKFQEQLAKNQSWAKKSPVIKAIPEWLLPVLPQWLREMTPKGELQKIFADKFVALDALRQADYLDSVAELNAAAAGMSARELKWALAAGEKTDPNIIAKIKANPALEAKVERFLHVAKKYNRFFEETFDISPEQQAYTQQGPKLLGEIERKRQVRLEELKEAYEDAAAPGGQPERLPALKAAIQDASKVLKFSDLKKPKYMDVLKQRHLNELDGILDETGWPTVYFAVSTDIQTGRGFAKMVEPLGGVFPDKTTKLAMKVAKGEVKSPREVSPRDLPPYLQERVAAQIQKVPFAISTVQTWRRFFASKFKGKARPYDWKETMMTIRGPKHTLNAKTLTLLRRAEELGYKAKVQMIKALIDIRRDMEIRAPGVSEEYAVAGGINKKPLKGGTKWDEHLADIKRNIDPRLLAPEHWENLNLAQELAGTGITPEELAKMFPGARPSDLVVPLPKDLANKWREIISMKRRGPTGKSLAADILIHTPNRILSFGLFRGDPFFGPKLAAQTAALQLYGIRSPKDLVAFFVSSVIASRPDVWKYFTPQMLASHGDPIGANMMESSISLSEKLAEATVPGRPVLSAALKGRAVAGHVLEPVKKLGELKGKADYIIPNRQRLEVALRYIFLRSEEAPASYRQLLAKMMNSEQALIDAAKHVRDPEKLARLRHAVADQGLMGDYSTMAARNRGFWNSVWVPAAWIAHQIKIVKNAPFEHRYKTMLLSALQGTQQQFEVDSIGGVPVKNKQGEPQFFPSGAPKRFKGVSVAPTGHELLTGALDLLFSAGEAATGQWSVASPKFEMVATMTPALQVLISIQSGIDPDTGKPWHETNPYLQRDRRGKLITIIGDRGKRFYVDKYTGDMYPTDSYFGPPKMLQMIQKLLPKQTAQAQRHWAGESEPSKLTVPRSDTRPIAVKEWGGVPVPKDKLESWLKSLGGFGAYPGRI